MARDTDFYPFSQRFPKLGAHFKQRKATTPLYYYVYDITQSDKDFGRNQRIRARKVLVHVGFLEYGGMLWHDLHGNWRTERVRLASNADTNADSQGLRHHLHNTLGSLEFGTNATARISAAVTWVTTRSASQQMERRRSFLQPTNTEMSNRGRGQIRLSAPTCQIANRHRNPSSYPGQRSPQERRMAKK